MRILRILVRLTFLALLLFFCIFRFTPTSPDRKERLLEQAAQIIDSAFAGEIAANSFPIQVGYARVNMTPDFPVRIAGYGRRPDFDGVHDSLYVHVMMLSQGDMKVAVISLDLMLITPELSAQIEQALASLSIDNIYFSASHTHSSFGGYGHSIAGEVVFGRDEKVVEHIVASTVNAVQQAMVKPQALSNVDFGAVMVRYAKNRLSKKKEIPQKFRRINMRLKNGKQLSLFSFNVHPTIIAPSVTELSNDYPGALNALNHADFSLFLAGTMGSTSSMTRFARSSTEKAHDYAQRLLNEPMRMESAGDNYLMYQKIPIPIRPLALTVSSSLQIRPWVFRLIFGYAPSYVTVMRLGKIVFIGLPVELSSEYYPELEKLADEKGVKLMLTTFNGSYLGYATPSKYFEVYHLETRETNWIGKYGGDYFAKVIQMILEKQ